MPELGESVFVEDFFERVINVSWGGTKGFLFSCGDGMFVSEDGEDWAQVPKGVPATSLAWTDDGKTYGVWMGIRDSSAWRSNNGAKTWGSVKLPKKAVALAGISSQEKEDDGSKKVYFAIHCFNDEGPGVDEIYISSDKGDTWKLALSIANYFNDNEGNEFFNCLQGGDGKFIVGTQRSEDRYDNGSAYVYESSGSGFGGRRMQYGPGTHESDPVAASYIRAEGYAMDSAPTDDNGVTAYVGFKSKQDQNSHEFDPMIGGSTTYNILINGASVHETNLHDRYGGTFGVGGFDGATGDGATVCSIIDHKYSYGLVFNGDNLIIGGTGGDQIITFIPQGQQGFLGSFCFSKGKGKKKSLFGGVAVFDGKAYAYVGPAGSMQQKISGNPLGQRAAIGAGKLGKF